MMSAQLQDADQLNAQEWAEHELQAATVNANTFSLEALKTPFNPKVIHWRVGSRTKDKSKGMPLAYIDARDVMKRLDDICRPENWQDDYTETPSGRVICKLSIRVNGEWITKSDGAGDTNVEGEKGGISDAFKRAAVKFGVGRYLYYLPSQWVGLDQYGKFTDQPRLPVWAIPQQD